MDNRLGEMAFLNPVRVVVDMEVVVSLVEVSHSVMLCCGLPSPERSGMSTACSRSASAHLYHAGSRLLPCDGAAD